ncbi:hypothetical protein CALVIDRAFT_213518 [Calocera viscosa TUFC12733]|uniref:Uncharacterized protein n=1 Tax=Calocera viscosa (strain TUFC12733) TaxID=1330018 RepID=A0A167RDF4_CALVF|nr:hypothetical protein CALVIDRAFT_213518 [Calocera viscosa TUFC12733]
MAKFPSSVRRLTVQRDVSPPTSSVSVPSVTLLMSAPTTMTIPPITSTPTSLLYNTPLMSSSMDDEMVSGTPTASSSPPGYGSSGPPPNPPPGIPNGPPPNVPPPQGIPGPEELVSDGHIPPWVIAIISIIVAIIIMLCVILAMRMCRSRRQQLPVYKVHMGTPRSSWEKGGALPASDTLTPLNPRNSLLISTPRRLDKKAQTGRKRPLKRPGTAESIGKRVVEGIASVARSHVPTKLVISKPIPVPNIVLEPPTPSSSNFTGLSTVPSFDSAALQPETTVEKLRNPTDDALPTPPSKRCSIHVHRGLEGDEAYEMVHLKGVESLHAHRQAPTRVMSNDLPVLCSTPSGTGPSITVTVAKETEGGSARSEIWDGYQDYLDFAEMGSPLPVSSTGDLSEVKSRSDRWSECKTSSSVYSEMPSQGSARELAAEANHHRLLHSSSVFEHGAGWKDATDDEVGEEDMSDLNGTIPVLTASPSADSTASVNIALWELVLGHGSITSMADITKNANLRKSRLSEVSTAPPVLHSPLILSTPHDDPSTFEHDVSPEIPEPEMMSRASCWSFLDDLEGEPLEANKVDEAHATREIQGAPHVSPLRIAKRTMDSRPSIVTHETVGPYPVLPFPVALICDDFAVDMASIPQLNDDSMSGDQDKSTVEDHLPSSPPPTDFLKDLLGEIPWYDGFKEELLPQPKDRVASKRLKPSRIPVRRISKRRSAIGSTPLTPKTHVLLRSAIPSPVYSTSARPRRAPTSPYARSHQKTTGVTKRADGTKKFRSSLIPGSLQVTSHSGMKAHILGRRVSITRNGSVGRASLIAVTGIAGAYVNSALSSSHIPPSSTFL